MPAHSRSNRKWLILLWQLRAGQRYGRVSGDGGPGGCHRRGAEGQGGPHTPRKDRPPSGYLCPQAGRESERELLHPDPLSLHPDRGPQQFPRAKEGKAKCSGRPEHGCVPAYPRTVRHCLKNREGCSK